MRMIIRNLASTLNSFLNGSLIYSVNLCFEKIHAYKNGSVRVYPLSTRTSPHLFVGNPETKHLAHLKP